MKCSPCGKTFTGQACYDQHIKSDKHKRKILSLGFLSNQTGTSSDLANRITVTDPESTIIQCDICNIKFHSLEAYHNHSVTLEHAQKVMLKNSEINLNCSIVSSSSITDKTNDGKDENVDQNEILPGFEESKSQSFSFAFCEACKKQFSGPEPYKQHMESELHKKKVDLQKNSSFANTNQNTSEFSCEPCNKLFSGQIPYIQHMTSETHKKKLQNLQFLKKYTLEVEPLPRMHVLEKAEDKLNIDNNTLFCKTCNIQCSGFIPYQQHINGITHLKNMRKEQEKSTFTLDDFVKPTIQQNSNNGNGISEQKMNVSQQQSNNNGNGISEQKMNVSQLIGGNNQQFKCQNMEMDYILPEKMENLRVISTEELEESIKIFLPNESIDFDKSGSEMHVDVTNENTTCNISEEIQIKEKSDIVNGYDHCDISEIQMDKVKEKAEVYQVCDFCNVQLLNKNEALSHFESKEHFKKRWC